MGGAMDRPQRGGGPPGRVRPVKAVLSERAAIDYMMATWRKSVPPQPSRLHLAVLHAVNPDPAEQILQRVRAEVEPAEAFVGSMGTTMIVHSGPGSRVPGGGGRVEA